MALKDKKLPFFSAIIFDMDGLVIDTETTYIKAWQYAAEEMGYHFSDKFCLSLSGLHSQTIEKRLFNECGDNFNLKNFQNMSGHYWRNYVQQHGIKQKQGLKILLKVITQQKIPFCLATNSLKKNALECLAFANLENRFKLIISRDQVKNGKPAPDIFFKAAKSLQQPISKCLVLEDSAIGIQAANNANAPSVLIPSHSFIETEALKKSDGVFNNLSEIAQLILEKSPKK